MTLSGGNSIISNGYNISTKTAIIIGTLNLTAGSSLIFEDANRAGFEASTGTLIMQGNGTHNVSIMSATEPNPTHIPTINGTRFQKYTFEYAKIYTINSIDVDGEPIACFFCTNVSAVGAWAFGDIPYITNTLINTEAAEGATPPNNANFTVNVTVWGDDLAEIPIYDVSVEVTCGSYFTSAYTLTDGAHTKYNYSFVMNTSSFLGGAGTLKVCANNTHNAPKTFTARESFKHLELHINNKVIDKNYIGKVEGEEAKTMHFKVKDGKFEFFKIDFIDRTGSEVRTTIDRGDYFKLTFKVKTDKWGTVRAKIAGSRTVSEYVHLMSNGYYFDAREPYNGKEESKTTAKYSEGIVTWSNPEWKPDAWVIIDPSVGAVNQYCKEYSFTMLSNPPVIDAVAVNQTWYYGGDSMIIFTNITFSGPEDTVLCEISGVNYTASGSGGTYNCTYGPLTKNTEVTYRIFANDTIGKSDTSSLYSVYVYGKLDELIRITEITEYTGNDIAMLSVRLEDTSDNPLLNAECNISILASGLNIVANATMAEDSASFGIYSYSYTVPNGNNDYIWRVSCKAADYSLTGMYQLQASRKGGENMAVIFGLLAMGFFIAAGILHLTDKKEEESVNILPKYLFQFAGILMGLFGLRTAAEAALLDYNTVVASNINTGVIFLRWILYIYIVYLLLKLLLYTIDAFNQRQE